jgi:outer membrane biosynthesis protein TonB
MRTSVALWLAAALLTCLLWSCFGTSDLPARQRAVDSVIQLDIARGPVAVDVQAEHSTPVQAAAFEVVYREPPDVSRCDGCYDIIDTPESSP